MKNVQLLTYRADLKSSLKELFRRTEQPQNVLEYEKSGGIHNNELKSNFEKKIHTELPLRILKTYFKMKA